MTFRHSIFHCRNCRIVEFRITVAKKMWKKLLVTDEEKQRFGKRKKSVISRQ